MKPADSSKMNFMIFGVIFSLFQLLKVGQGQGQGQAPQNQDGDRNKTREVYLYRLINWCIIGKGEYLLEDWPLSQFKPILQQTLRSEHYFQEHGKDKINQTLGIQAADVWAQYDLKFAPISCANLAGTGLSETANPQNFLHRMHIKLMPTTTDAITFQGVLIQAVHAPFNLGFPFGVFDTDQEFKCSECTHANKSVIVGCLSRPDIAPMHPTVAMFHFKRKNHWLPPTPTPIPAAQQQPGPGAQTNQQQGQGPVATDDLFPEFGVQNELHWNFKWWNLPCASSRLVEFWVLMVIDFEKNTWTLKKFGPYDLNQFDLSSTLEAPKMGTTTVANAPTVALPGLPLPMYTTCHPFKKNPITFPVTRARFHQARPRVCFRSYTTYDKMKCEMWEDCMRVHTCANADTAAGPVPVASQITVPAVVPNTVICHGADVNLVPKTDLTRVRFVGDFDKQCVRRYPGNSAKYEMSHGGVKLTQPHKVCPEWQGRYYCNGDQTNLDFDKNTIPNGDDSLNRSFPSSHCIPCVSITEEITTPPDDTVPIFKRDAHGVMMIYAFFFFNPVSLNTARFYKETLHEKQVKGWKMWLVIHVGFAVFASGLSYIGYTFPSFKELDAHIWLGYGAMFGVSSGIVTGWIRHKNEKIKVAMFYIHALSGYIGWAFAIASMVFAPRITAHTRFVSYAASGICLVAILIMTVHICSVDSSMGIRPGRSHLPIVEIRFEDIIPPKSKFRKVFFYIYIVLQFLVCLGMLVL